ncbi:MAG TPA: hypothetical protein PKE45_02360 [Caldilineaceae bacterium]|nr:hypothetical protein [Caldilineaceae bacterium]
MPRLQTPYSLWLILVVLGITLETLGIAIDGPLWLRYSLIGGGVLLIIISIVLIGRMQRPQ